MAQQKTANRNRFDFSKIPATIQIPNLIEVQKRSYDRFLQMDALPSERDDAGLQAVFQSVFPITDFRNVSQLDFVEYAIGNWECKCGHLKGLNHLRTTCRNCGATVKTDPFHLGDVLCTKCGTYNANTPDFCNKCGDPVGLQLKYDVAECEERGMTYSAPLKVTMRLTIYDKDPDTGNRSIRDMKEQEVFFGDIPLMTANGTFIINGTERVIVSQLHRSPGVFFETANNRTYFLGKIIPYRGSWVEFEYDQKNVLYVRIDRKRKFLGSIFLRALGLRSDEDILRTFYTVDRLAVRDKKLYWTLDPSVDRPTNLLGMKLAHRIATKGGEEIVHSGRKLTLAVLKDIQKHRISEIEVDLSDLEGAFVAGDVIDTNTGEVLLEANSELTADKLSKMLDAGVSEVHVFFGNPRIEHLGQLLSRKLGVGFQQNLAGVGVNHVAGNKRAFQIAEVNLDFGNPVLLDFLHHGGGEFAAGVDDLFAALGSDAVRQFHAEQVRRTVRAGVQRPVELLVMQGNTVHRVKGAEDVLIRAQTQGAQEDAAQELALAIDAHVQHALLVVFELDPRAAVRDDLAQEVCAVVGVLEEHARRPVQLADNDTLGTVDDERA